MKFLNENKGIIISFIIGVIIASSITVYAYSYIASDIKYTDDKSVADALNDLYNRLYIESEITGKGKYWNKGTKTITGGDTVNIEVGFEPSYIIFTRASDKCDIVYNSTISTTKQYIRGTENNLNRGDTGIVSIGTIVSFTSIGNTATWYWMAVK